jgi:hypothetical protein
VRRAVSEWAGEQPAPFGPTELTTTRDPRPLTYE